MLDILTHFIECRWGGHYGYLFSNVIKPYLDNLELLKFFLKSNNVIIDEFNNNNGYKMFNGLYEMLLQVDNVQIKEFIKSEFEEVTSI